MSKFSLKEFAEFEAIAIGAGEYGEAVFSARNVAEYERFKLQQEKQKKKKIKKF